MVLVLVGNCVHVGDGGVDWVTGVVCVAAGVGDVLVVPELVMVLIAN